MAAALPLNIPIPQSAAIASFNYTDIADATGVIAFQGAQHSEAGTAAYYLTTNSPYSNAVYTSGGPVSSNDFAVILTKNFDVKFNRPQNFKGYSYLNLTIGGTGAGSGTGVPVCVISGATLNNATTSTVLATASSDTFTFKANTDSESKTVLVQFDLTGGPYHFKAGEILRLTVPLHAKVTGTAGAHAFGYGHDPKDRSDPGTGTSLVLSGANTTQLVLYIPSLLNTV